MSSERVTTVDWLMSSERFAMVDWLISSKRVTMIGWSKQSLHYSTRVHESYSENNISIRDPDIVKHRIWDYFSYFRRLLRPDQGIDIWDLMRIFMPSHKKVDAWESNFSSRVLISFTGRRTLTTHHLWKVSVFNAITQALCGEVWRSQHHYTHITNLVVISHSVLHYSFSIFNYKMHRRHFLLVLK